MRAGEDDDVLASIQKELVTISVLVFRYCRHAWHFGSTQRFNQGVGSDRIELLEIAHEYLKKNVTEGMLHDAVGIEAEPPRAAVESPARNSCQEWRWREAQLIDQQHERRQPFLFQQSPLPRIRLQRLRLQGLLPV